MPEETPQMNPTATTTTAMAIATATTYLTSLPKAELHLHLEGTITPPTLVALSQRHDTVPITLPQAEALYTYTDFSHFLEIWDLVCQRLRTPEDYATIAREMCVALAAQGVRHAEVFVAVGSLVELKPWVNVEQVFEAMEVARVDVETRLGLSVLWIIDASRQRGLEHVGRIFGLAADLKRKFPAVVGVGIGGDEAAGPCKGLGKAFAEAKKAGLRLTAHCGEATGPIGGPREIRDALEIGVERIGHAFCAQFDESLLEELKRRQTPLELNVTSNVRTGVCLSLAGHPIRNYVRSGLACTINSDDPAMFGSNLLREYVLINEQFDFSREEMKALAANSFRCSFLDDARKRQFISLVEQYGLDG